MDSPLNYLGLLPDEMLLKLLSETDDLKTLFKWCQISKRINLICQDEGFWHNKYRKDYGESTLEKGETWRKEYKRRKLNINSPISAGYNHYGIIDQKENLYMVGENYLGQLGVEKDIKKSKIPILVKFPNETQKVISISTGQEVSGAVTKDGKVYIWGYNAERSSPSNQEIIWLPMELILQEKAIKIVIDTFGYIILLEDSSVYFYSNKHPSHPMKGYLKWNVIDISFNDAGTFSIVTKDHKLYMWGDLPDFMIQENENIKKPIHIPIPEPVIKVSAKDESAMALSTTGKIYTLGWDLSGYVPNEGIKPILIKLPEKIVQIGGYYETFAALSETGRLYMWGDDGGEKIGGDQEGNLSPLSEISVGAPINFVSVGGSFTIAVSSNGVVNYWGSSSFAPE